MILVLDASVVVKWLLPEEGQLDAYAILDSAIPVAAPHLLAVEVETALSKKARLENVPANEIRKTLAFFLEHFLPNGRPTLHPDEDLLPDALDLSVKFNHQLSDCIYLALARKLNARLVTADEKFVSKARLLGDTSVIALGADLSAGSAGRR